MIPEWSEDVVRAVSAFVRTELQAPVARLSGMIDILAEDAADAGLTAYEEDLLKMRAGGARLSELVSTLLERSNEDGGKARASPSELRHDLRTPIAGILGYAELMAEEARGRGDTQLLEPLAHTLDAAARLLKEIDQIVAFSEAGGVAAAAAAPWTVI